MRPILTLALCSVATIFTCPLLAQSQHKNPFTTKHYGATVQSAPTAGKSTATASRLIAAASDEYNGSNFIPWDSSFVTYSGQRGGDLNSDDLKFDNGTAWYNNTGGGLEEVGKYTQTFDMYDNILSTIIKEWNGTAFVNSEGTVHTYDGNGNMLTETEIEWNTGTNSWDSIYKYVYTYDVNNKLIDEMGMSGNGSSWDNEYRFVNNLDVNGNVILNVYLNWNAGTSTWDSMNKQHYAFNTDNLEIEAWFESWQMSAWQKTGRNLTTYNTTDLPLTRTSQSWNGSNWVDVMIITNTYTNDDLVNSLEQYANGNNFKNEINTFDGNHNILSAIKQNWVSASWVNDRKMEYTYNSFNQAITNIEYRWISNAWGHGAANFRARYYYETFNTGVNDSKLDNSFKVYPIPAQSFVRVEKTWAQPTDFIVSVTDMQGRLIRTYSEKGTTNYTKTIDVSQLSAGNYFIKIAATGGKASYQQFSVIR